MRDGPRLPGVGRRSDVLSDGLVEWLEGGCQPLGESPRRRRRGPDDVEPDPCERITLIEFMWTGVTGAQPVVYVSREWLQ